jgi:hypothetical protein
MSKIRLYLDDVRIPSGPDWVLVKDYQQFVDKVEEVGLENIEVISLDHDLGEGAMIEYYNNVRKNYQLDYDKIEEKTGFDVCKYLVNKSIDTNIPLPTTYVHSANPIGSANMMGYINNYLMNCRLPQTCVRVTIEHTIDEAMVLSPEARKAKWDRSNSSNDGKL